MPAIGYDRGAASAAELVRAFASLTPVAFLVPDMPHAQRMQPVLAELGETSNDG